MTDDMRAGEGEAPLRVSTLELFFDLVFVFAITQLTGILSHEVTVEDGGVWGDGQSPQEQGGFGGIVPPETIEP